MEEECPKAVKSFLEESCHLEEVRTLYKQGKCRLRSINLFSLHEIFEEYGELRLLGLLPVKYSSSILILLP